MKIEVDMEALLSLLKDDADYSRKRRKDNLPLPSEEIEEHKLSDVYINGWNNGYRQGADYVLGALRGLMDGLMDE